MKGTDTRPGDSVRINGRDWEFVEVRGRQFKRTAGGKLVECLAMVDTDAGQVRVSSSLGRNQKLGIAALAAVAINEASLEIEP